MNESIFAQHHVATVRHRTAWVEAGPADGPLMIFIHGWPELGIVWRAQMNHFAAAGWRCVAPDMRGYGGSSVPTTINAYAVRELVADMIELHDVLGGAPAVWVGHDWGSPVVWALAAHHAGRCRGVVNLCVPYFARGFALPNLVPLVDRELYPIDKYPVGQWDYQLFYRENFARAAQEFEVDVAATFAMLFQPASADGIKQPAMFAGIRANGGWFGAAGRAPIVERDTTMLSQADYDTFVRAYSTTGFSGANAWYMNEAANLDYAAEAPNFGRLTLPVLFLHAAWDVVCSTAHSPLAEPMRADCADLSEITIEGGHEVQLERRAEVNAAIGEWIDAKNLR